MHWRRLQSRAGFNQFPRILDEYSDAEALVHYTWKHEFLDRMIDKFEEYIVTETKHQTLADEIKRRTENKQLFTKSECVCILLCLVQMLDSWAQVGFSHGSLTAKCFTFQKLDLQKWRNGEYLHRMGDFAEPDSKIKTVFPSWFEKDDTRMCEIMFVMDEYQYKLAEAQIKELYKYAYDFQDRKRMKAQDDIIAAAKIMTEILRLSESEEGVEKIVSDMMHMPGYTMNLFQWCDVYLFETSGDYRCEVERKNKKMRKIIKDNDREIEQSKRSEIQSRCWRRRMAVCGLDIFHVNCNLDNLFESLCKDVVKPSLVDTSYAKQTATYALYCEDGDFETQQVKDVVADIVNALIDRGMTVFVQDSVRF
jgi:hypothetical protein